MTNIIIGNNITLPCMPAHYDKFDYPSYWQDRVYEHKAEVIAISSFLAKIKTVTSLLEVGAGYGRLTSSYFHRAKKIILTDPSAKLLSIAKDERHSNKLHFVHCSVEKLCNKVKNNAIDLIIMVRVLHHINDIKATFDTVHSVLKPRGYFILEFANKLHLKSVLKELLKGNFTVFYDIFPKDVRSRKSIKKHTIGFKNYHPGYILDILENCGFEIIEIRSVSNVRSTFLKKYIPVEVLCSIEKYFQTILSHIYFGPSTFVLVRKKL